MCKRGGPSSGSIGQTAVREAGLAGEGATQCRVQLGDAYQTDKTRSLDATRPCDRRRPEISDPVYRRTRV